MIAAISALAPYNRPAMIGPIGYNGNQTPQIGLRPSISGQFGVFVGRETNKVAGDDGLEGGPSGSNRVSPGV